MQDLRGKVVVVTGASSGIGLAIARAFAREGCRLALAARRTERLDEARSEVEALGAEAITVPTDVREEGQVRALVEAAEARWGRVDILVNNAGFGVFKRWLDISSAEVEDLMRTNYLGAVYAAKAVLPGMVARRSGHIINIASIAAKLPTPGYGAYSDTKAALDSFSETLRAELARYGIKVTAAHPSPTRTGFFAKSAGEQGARAERLGRLFMQEPEDVARAIVQAAKYPRPELYPQFGSRLLSIARAVFPRAMRLALRGIARLYR